MLDILNNKGKKPIFPQVHIVNLFIYLLNMVQ